VSFAADVKCTAIPILPQLAAGEESRQSIEILLTGFAGKNVRVDVRSDVGAYTGSLSVDAMDLLNPLPMSSRDFESYRSKLKGINEAERSYPLTSLGLRASLDLEDKVLQLMKKLVNVYVAQGPGSGEIYLAGFLRKAGVDDKVLLTVTSSR
jgi:hypothetical protein